MRRNLLLTSLLTLAVVSACGGKGEQERGDLDELAALGNQSPPRDEQQPPPSGDQPEPADRLPTSGDTTCDFICDPERTFCNLPGCADSCLEAQREYPRCFREWQSVLTCVIASNIFVCANDHVARGDGVFRLCAREYGALAGCADFSQRDVAE